jgi:hypothetical protein
MALYVPRTSIGETLPAAQSQSLWANTPGEEIIREIPSLYSWLDGSAVPNGSGIYADRGPQGNNWIQAASGNQPAQLSNWHGSGQNAFNFPNTNLSIAPNFHMPAGGVSVLIVFDLNSALATNDNIDHPLFGSILSAGNSPLIYAYNKTIIAASSGASLSRTSAALAVNAPHSFILSYGPVKNAFAVQIDGGAWSSVQAATSIVSHLPQDTTGVLGICNWLTSKYWYGAVATIMIFNTELYDASEASDLALLHSGLSAKYGAAL